MKSFAKKIALVAMTLVTAAAPLATAAQAGEWRLKSNSQRIVNYREFSDRQNQWRPAPRHWRHHGARHHVPRHVYRHHRHHDDAVALGVLGLAAGALIGGAIANSPGYVETRPAYRPQRVGSLEPWTQGWYDYCSQRYRSFDPRSGTFRGYDGRDHFCVAN
jgi:BA14K-like protein.